MSSHLRAEAENSVGLLTLDRAKALNALDLTMIRDLTHYLTLWAQDPAIERVVITSASPKAFCAGGDIRAIREFAVQGNSDAIYQYFEEEYSLNRFIAEYPKEYIALIDGFALGGGLGISVHGGERFATENAVAAMPETAIGFFPDVGASYFLSRLPGELGTYLGLTGTRLAGSDFVASGLATAYVSHSDISGLLSSLLSGRDLAAIKKEYCREFAPLSLPLERMTSIFSGENLPNIFERLRSESDQWACETFASLASVSPTSLLVTLRMLREASTRSLADCLGQELHLVTTVTPTHDFAEGVRAMLVDKDKNPQWNPPTVADVSSELIDNLFAASRSK